MSMCQRQPEELEQKTVPCYIGYRCQGVATKCNRIHSASVNQKMTRKVGALTIPLIPKFDVTLDIIFSVGCVQNGSSSFVQLEDYIVFNLC